MVTIMVVIFTISSTNSSTNKVAVVGIHHSSHSRDGVLNEEQAELAILLDLGKIPTLVVVAVVVLLEAPP